MENTIITIWFFIIFIPGIYLFYKCLQCFDYEKILKRGQIASFKIVYMLVCIILSYLFAKAFTYVFELIYNFLSNI